MKRVVRVIPGTGKGYCPQKKPTAKILKDTNEKGEKAMDRGR